MTVDPAPAPPPILPATTVTTLIGVSDTFARLHAQLRADQAQLLEASSPPCHQSQYIVDRRVRDRPR